MTISIAAERAWLMVCCQLGRLQLDIAVQQANQPRRRRRRKN
jgi:hypothetical protein